MIERFLHLRQFFACLLGAATGMASSIIRGAFSGGESLFAGYGDPRALGFSVFQVLLIFCFFYDRLPRVCHLSFWLLNFRSESGFKESGRLAATLSGTEQTDRVTLFSERSIMRGKKQGASETPTWVRSPKRKLFTGIAVIGAVGFQGKTASAMYPFAEQILAYRAEDRMRAYWRSRLGGKRAFWHPGSTRFSPSTAAAMTMSRLLYSDYRYTPHNDLDASALAYSIASLLNNLFGRGKEPFWQQAYTNLVSFIILLHKIAFDYVTLLMSMNARSTLRCSKRTRIVEALGKSSSPPRLGDSLRQSI